jgi:hypothetical protein
MIFRLVMHGVSTPSSPHCRIGKRARANLCRWGQRWSSLPRQLSRNESLVRKCCRKCYGAQAPGRPKTTCRISTFTCFFVKTPFFTELAFVRA